MPIHYTMINRNSVDVFSAATCYKPGMFQMHIYSHPRRRILRGSHQQMRTYQYKKLKYWFKNQRARQILSKRNNSKAHHRYQFTEVQNENVVQQY